MTITRGRARPPEQAGWEPSYGATVAVEVGPGRGALILLAPTALLGSEVEICSVSEPVTRTHTAIRERRLPDGVVCAGVFGSLPAGLYRVGAAEQLVRVTEGAVSEVDLGQAP